MLIHDSRCESIAGLWCRALSCAFSCHGATLFGCFSAKCLQRKLTLLMVFGLLWLLAYSGLELRRAPRLLMSNSKTAIAVREACLHPRPGVYPMSGIICSQGGHLISGQMAKAFSSAWTPRHLCLPGILASLLKAVQSKKALLPMYFSKGGIASSTRAAQFIKALTRIRTIFLSRVYQPC